jgi:hypothetical protein
VRRRRRTAFFLNLCGVMVQRRLGSASHGISTSALMSTLANVLIDWYCISAQRPGVLGFDTTGDIVWVPSRFGGTSRVLAAKQDKSKTKPFGLFELVSELLNTDMYRDYGFQRSERRKDGTYLTLAEHIAFDAGVKSSVSSMERHYWELLADRYAALSARQRIALASARTPQFALLCMFVQFAYWRRDMRRTVDGIARSRKVDSTVFGDARAAMHQLVLMPQHISDVAEYMSAPHDFASTELSGTAPCKPIIVNPSFEPALTKFLEHLPQFADAHRLMKFGVARLLGQEVDVSDATRLVNTLSAETIALPNHLTRGWASLFSRDAVVPESAARLLSNTLDWISASVENVVGMRIPSLETLYREALTVHYPLPRGQFVGEF